MAAHTTVDLTNLLPATFTAPGLTEKQFLALCEQFPDATLEYTEDGEVIVMPPIDPLNGARGARVVQRLSNWAEKAGRGLVCGPDAGFLLPSGARRSPDASWFEGFPSGKQRFPVFAPQFVIEVRSPDDRIARLRDKMQRYLNAGVKLAWLIDPLEGSVTIYRPERDPEELANPVAVTGDGPVEGFVLDLQGIL